MTYNPHKHHRRSIRLREYDYSQEGMYFVTVCVQKGQCLLEDGVIQGMILLWWEKLPEKFPSLMLDAFVIMPNHIHFIITMVGAQTGENGEDVGAHPRVRPYEDEHNVGAHPRVRPYEDEHNVGAHPRVRPFSGGQTRGSEGKGQTHGSAPTLGTVVQWFKTMTTNAYIRGVKKLGWQSFPGKLWQRNYYEQIIRNERHLIAVRRYIQNNPVNWKEDKLHPQALPNKFNRDW